ncbi:MAG: hypothetical protein ACKO1N_07560 [Erythrobacter sp.]
MPILGLENACGRTSPSARARHRPAYSNSRITASTARLSPSAALLETIIIHARAEGLTALSLETGTGPAFEPALALYRRRGFVNGPAFADYVLTDFNQCLHLVLD